jgi:hypothetical protein
MQPSIPMLTQEQLNGLRARHPFEADTSGILAIARERGWLDANVSYLAQERARGADAMRDLLSEVGVSAVPSVADAVQLLRLACQVFTGEAGFEGILARQSSHSLRITAAPCPIYRALEERQWTGVTACPSWHRRRGWLDAGGSLAELPFEVEQVRRFSQAHELRLMLLVETRATRSNGL